MGAHTILETKKTYTDTAAFDPGERRRRSNGSTGPSEKTIGPHDAITWDRGDFEGIMRPHKADDPSQYGHDVPNSGIDFCDGGVK
jgi:hypothetical protein